MRVWTWIVGVVLLGTLGLGLWYFWYAPREAERQYRIGYEAYETGDLEEALPHLNRAHALRPRMPEPGMLLGWAHWRLDQLEDAEAGFRAAAAADPDWFEAKTALAMVLMALDRPRDAVAPLEAAARARPRDLPTHLRLGEAYRSAGRHQEAVALYRAMLRWDPPSHEAERALLEIFGYPSLEEGLTFALPEPAVRSGDREPRRPELSFRARGDHLQAMDGDRWRSVYVTGVNLGPARPGEWAVSASLEFTTYREWFRQIAAGGGNTVRAYTILPPAFYRALEAHNREAPEPLWLIQEVWLDDEARDLFDPDTRETFRREVRRAIDVIHGQGDIPCRTGHYCGLFGADVSDWVLGLALGREVEPSLVLATNAGSPDATSYQGEYVSLEEGHATEAWFAEMLDLAARYETETYRTQRPLSVVNWPPLDPIHQPTEASQAEEIEARRALGEVVVESVPEFPNDMNVVSLEMTRYSTEPAFQAGLFALYHVYQHWPDFLFLEPAYAEARDGEGPNRYLGYLEDLKSHYQGMPLLIGEYGAATSPVPVHLHPQGWHNGGLTEVEQAELLVRFSRNIRDTGMAGGIVFAWLDEWWKQVHDEFTAPFEPRENDPLWLNALDPEEYFGLVGYRPFDPVPLLRGREEDWEGARVLYAGGEQDEAGGTDPGQGSNAPGPDRDRNRVLRQVQAASDYAYVYLRVDLAPGVAWDDHRLLVALNPLPGQVGSTRIPGVELELEDGAPFLLRLEGSEDGHLAVSESYNPWGEVTPPGRPELVRIQPRRNLEPSLGPQGFQDMVIEANRPRYARDGTEFAPITFNRSVLPFGTADPGSTRYSSHAAWHLDRTRGMVEVRIPWGLLLVLDPTDRRVFSGMDGEGRPLASVSPGIAVSVLVLDRAAPADDPGPHPPLDAFPAPGNEGVQRGAPAVYTWEPWDRVRYRPYFKPGYHALRELWTTWPRFLN